MKSSLVGLAIMAAAFFVTTATGSGGVMFEHNYKPLWGEDHIRKINVGNNSVQLLLDQYSGAGFISKLRYGSGFFHMDIKLPDNLDLYGVLPTYYLSSTTEPHDEVDFEFLGNDTLPFILHTNVYINGIRGREQRMVLWFDPRTEYHKYSILWNSHQIVFLIDGIPVRVFRNTAMRGWYPSQPMWIMATIWQADWATQGKSTKWSQAPFIASYQGFGIEGCEVADGVNVLNDCFSNQMHWWDSERYWQLSPQDQSTYRSIRRKYLVYDYCSNFDRFLLRPQECEVNQ